MLNPPPSLTSRRRFLTETSTGLGAIALATMLHEETRASERKVGPHFTPKAKRVIHIFSPGGVSHIDSFDYKPELVKRDGQSLTSKGTLDTFFGRPGNLMKNVYSFKQRGQCGAWVSDLFPHLAECVDDLCFMHTLVTKSNSHSPACFQMNSGFTQNAFPCMGAWLSYGLGSLNQELPTFVLLPDPRGLPNSGTANWSNGFLPAEHQGTAFMTDKPEPIPNLKTPDAIPPNRRQAGFDLLQQLNRKFADENPGDSALAARVRAYELAAKMQTSIPEAVSFAQETEATKKLYGLDNPVIAPSARNFLLARRLLERGVRFVQIYNGAALGGNPRINWDAHEDIKSNHDAQGVLLDQPCAALLKDLKQRGMMDDTLVFWSSEFGRTPFTEGLGAKGRDHHPHCFTVWLAGAGLKKGFRFGMSDEVGFAPAEHPVSIYDLHATILHVLGIDHKQLTYYHNGIQRRLTDVHGEVVREVLM